MTSVCQRLPIRCPTSKTINNIQHVKLQKRTEGNTEALHVLCPWSFIVLTMRTESEMQALGLYLGGAYIRKEDRFIY